MDAISILLLLIFGLTLVWYSYLIWFKPQVVLRWSRTFRSRYYGVKIGGPLMKRMYGDQLDANPTLELWLARLGVLLMYGIVIFVISRFIRGSG